MEDIKQYRVVGLMSGTSLDGVDIALCNFRKHAGGWSFAIERAHTCKYTDNWKHALMTAENLPGLELSRLHNAYGKYLGELVVAIAGAALATVDFIASHGHTVFHQPEAGLTLQIGSGACIAAVTRKTVVCDFRSSDIALGGQGAPLVPVGDKLLFGAYGYCLNLGGFANISYDDDLGKRLAFDICPVNIVCNDLVRERKLDFDESGMIGRSGIICEPLLSKLNDLDYYKLDGPRSLGKEWVFQEVMPLLEHYAALSLEDKLRTFYQHVVEQVAKVTAGGLHNSVLVTGGGAHNHFLMELFRSILKPSIEIPEKAIIDFKEAIVFAFLGVLRMQNEVNCLKTVTGASKDNTGGAVYYYK